MAPAGDGPGALAGTSWRLTYVDGRAWPIGDAPDVTLTFSERRLSGFNGCNEYGARWQMSGRRLDVEGRFVMTLVKCEGEAAWVEARLLEVLSTSPRATIRTDELRLTSQPRGVMVFAPGAE